MSKFLIEQQAKSFESAWSLYIRNFAAVLVLNAAGLALIEVLHVREMNITLAFITVAFILGNGGGIWMAWAMTAFSFQCDTMARHLLRGYIASTGRRGAVARIATRRLARVIVPGRLGLHGGIVYIVSHVALLLCWLGVAIYYLINWTCGSKA